MVVIKLSSGTHGRVSLTTAPRGHPQETSSCRKWELTWRATAGQCPESKRPWNTQSKRDVSIKPCPRASGSSVVEEVKRCQMNEENSVVHAQHRAGAWRLETHTGPAQVQA